MIKLLPILNEIRIDTSIRNVDQLKKGQKYDFDGVKCRLVMILKDRDAPYIFKVDGEIGHYDYSEENMKFYLEKGMIRRI